MGSCFSTDKVQPQQAERFERFGDSQSDGSGNENVRKFAKSRSCTDVFFFALMISFFVILAILLLNCVVNGDINRIINGYDQCGNVCGHKNYREDESKKQFACKGIDMTTKRYILVTNASGKSVNESSVKKKCVENCETISGYRPFLNRCVPSKESNAVNKFTSKTGLRNFFQEAAEDLHLCWKEVLYLCLIALGFSIVIMLLFRYFVGAMVWIVLIGVILASVAGTIYLWILYAQSKQIVDNTNEEFLSEIDSRNTSSYMIFAIIATIVTLIVVLLIFVMRKRIQLVVQLFKEAGKAIAAMPLLILEPLLTFVSLILVVSFWLYFSLWIQSAGFLTFRAEEDLYYKKNMAMKVTRWYNIVAMLWMTQFVIGCQHMVIAGAVATWYFMRDKSKLGSPILYSAFNLLRYHLGSVALGSFIITIVQTLQLLLNALKNYLGNRQGKCVEWTLKCCQCYLFCLEKILKYLSRNAYIEVAMHGYSFCKGGREAFKMLMSNALRVTVINSVGDFVLFLGKVLVVVSTVLIGVELLQHKEGLQHIWVPLGMAGLFAYFVSHCCMTVYEMAIDTIFLCFCEDCEENDGITKPYYMSKNLMEFVENSQKALAYLDKTSAKSSQAWQNRPSTISDKVDK